MPRETVKNILTLPIGAKAPDFELKGIDDKMYTLSSFSDKKDPGWSFLHAIIVLPPRLTKTALLK